MTESNSLIPPLLREMRADVSSLREEVQAGFAKVDARFDKLERRFDNLREAVNGEAVLGRYAAAEVEERPEAIERRIAALEGRN